MVTCNHGFKINGPSSSYCGNDGRWNPRTTPNCQGKIISELQLFWFGLAFFFFQRKFNCTIIFDCFTNKAVANKQKKKYGV